MGTEEEKVASESDQKARLTEGLFLRVCQRQEGSGIGGEGTKRKIITGEESTCPANIGARVAQGRERENAAENNKEEKPHTERSRVSAKIQHFRKSENGEGVGARWLGSTKRKGGVRWGKPSNAVGRVSAA